MINSFATQLKSYRPILTMISLGYLLVLGGLVIVGMQINRDIVTLQEQTRNLYEHAFQVNSAARQARRTVSVMRNEILYALAVRGEGTDSKLAQQIGRYDASLKADLDIIEQRFSGDEAKVVQARELLKRWREELSPLIALMKTGRDAAAEKILITQTGSRHAELVRKMDAIVDDSTIEATVYAQENERESEILRTELNLLLGGFAVFTLIAGGMTAIVVLRQLYKRDILLARERERIVHMAHYDELTQLPNRAMFLDRLKQGLLAAKRDHEGMALLFLDLDGFKKVNDTLGHHAGDLLLKGVADRLRHCVRESDTVARLGGDEFTVLLNEAHESNSASRVAQKIIESIAQPFELDGTEVNVGVSIGIAYYSEAMSGSDELIRVADQAMYEAKSSGKNTFRCHNEQPDSKAIAKE